jgi:hypothetical protein
MVRWPAKTCSPGRRTAISGADGSRPWDDPSDSDELIGEARRSWGYEFVDGARFAGASVPIVPERRVIWADCENSGPELSYRSSASKSPFRRLFGGAA